MAWDASDVGVTQDDYWFPGSKGPVLDFTFRPGNVIGWSMDGCSRGCSVLWKFRGGWGRAGKGGEGVY